MKIAFVFGTRPEILKLSPLIKESINIGLETVIIHTNQHYSYELDEIFFEELDLPNPHYNLKVGSSDHNIQLSKMLVALDPIYKSEKPDFVFVQGDTNSTLAGALAAVKMGIKIAHVEAGLRSYDREMPEEINRILTDNISDYLFAVTEVQEKILESEGIDKSKVFCVGNTIVDTLFDRSPEAAKHIEALSKFQLQKNNYFLLTMHRPSNVDDSKKLVEILDNLNEISIKYDKPFLWPIHPRTKAKIEFEKIKVPESIILSEPLGYLDFLSLIINSNMIFTDSGGIQEEACILQKPCLTLRNNTERPETIEVGANYLVGNSLELMIGAIEKFKTKSLSWNNPFGQNNVSKRILDSILQ